MWLVTVLTVFNFNFPSMALANAPPNGANGVDEKIVPGMMLIDAN